MKIGPGFLKLLVGMFFVCLAGIAQISNPPSSSGGTTINPTNNVIPVRTSATTFGDSNLTNAAGSITNSQAYLGPDGIGNNVTYSFTSATNTGWWRSTATGDPILEVGGSQAIDAGGAGTKIQFSQPWCDWQTGNTCLSGFNLSAASSKLIEITGSNNAIFHDGNNVIQVASDFSTASTTLVTITGLTWNIGAAARNYSFHCALAYSQATAAAADAFGIQAATNAPTNIFATGEVNTNATALTDGVLAILNTTTATNIVSFTPGATATNFVATLDGTIENPASANAINIMILTGSAADTITVKRGSFCNLF